MCTVKTQHFNFRIVGESESVKVTEAEGNASSKKAGKSRSFLSHGWEMLSYHHTHVEDSMQLQIDAEIKTLPHATCAREKDDSLLAG